MRQEYIRAPNFGVSFTLEAMVRFAAVLGYEGIRGLWGYEGIRGLWGTRVLEGSGVRGYF